MNFKNRQNISDNEFNIVREILGYNSIDESIRNITGYGENKKDEKRLVTPAIPDTPTKIAKKAKNDADDISVKENADNATKSTVIENIRNKFLSGITTLSLLAASPGNASDNLSTIKNINPDKKLFQGAENIKPKEKVMYDLIPGEDAKKVKDTKSDKNLFQSEDFINEAQASSTHTGKIKSSRRIMSVLQAAAENDKEAQFQFDNGTSATIQPALAKMTIRYYEGLSEFEKAESAKLMRKSFKDFLSVTKR